MQSFLPSGSFPQTPTKRQGLRYMSPTVNSTKTGGLPSFGDPKGDVSKPSTWRWNRLVKIANKKIWIQTHIISTQTGGKPLVICSVGNVPLRVLKFPYNRDARISYLLNLGHFHHVSPTWKNSEITGNSLEQPSKLLWHPNDTGWWKWQDPHHGLSNNPYITG